MDAGRRSAFQLLQSFQTTGSKPPLFYYVFDILQLNGRSLLALPLWQRKALAKKLTEGIHPQLRFSDSIRADSARLVKAMQARGSEGLVGKKRDSGTNLAGVRVLGSNSSGLTNRSSSSGATMSRCSQPFRRDFSWVLRTEKLRFASKVGTGFNETTLRLLYTEFQKLASKECPFTDLPEQRSASTGGLSRAEMRRCTWVRPKLVCQVRFAEWTRDGHLRQPALSRIA